MRCNPWVTLFFFSSQADSQDMNTFTQDCASFSELVCVQGLAIPCILILYYWLNTGLSSMPCNSISCCLAYVLEQHGLKDHCDCDEMCCVRSACVVNVNKVSALSNSAKPSVWQGYRKWQVLAPVSPLHWAYLWLSSPFFALTCLDGLQDGSRLVYNTNTNVLQSGGQFVTSADSSAGFINCCVVNLSAIVADGCRGWFSTHPYSTA